MPVRLDHLLVPVGALDQPHHERKRPGTAPGPLQDALELVGRVAQIGLEHDAGAGAVAELVLGQEVQDQLRHRVAGVQRLHVDVQVGPAVTRLAQQSSEALGGVARGEVHRLVVERLERAPPARRERRREALADVEDLGVEVGHGTGR